MSILRKISNDLGTCWVHIVTAIKDDIVVTTWEGGKSLD